MRLWTLHPKYLDAIGLVALWREALLAQQVLRGRTKGYRHHPQLHRFLSQAAPLACITAYLRGVYDESLLREYRFDGGKVGRRRGIVTIVETEGQLLYEWRHLKRKLCVRAPERYRALLKLAVPLPHPLFRIIPGDVRDWERVRHEPRGAARDRK